jgi:nucleotide-binding universal stress UspA family protein
MLPLKRILCPTDLSADARAALRAAGEMARYFGSELTVLHVCPPNQPAVWPHDGMAISPYPAGLSREENLALREKELVDEARSVLPADLNLKLRVEEGEPAEVIVDIALRTVADMVVIAPHGHGRLRKAIFGSTAEEVVRHSPCPVITLHAGQEAAEQMTGQESREVKA